MDCIIIIIIKIIIIIVFIATHVKSAWQSQMKSKKMIIKRITR